MPQKCSDKNVSYIKTGTAVSWSNNCSIFIECRKKMREHLCKSCTTCKCSLSQTDISKTFKNMSKYINGDWNVPIIQTENIFIFKFAWISSSLCEPSVYKEFQCAPLFQFVRFFLFGVLSFLHTGWQNVSTKCNGKDKYRSWVSFWRPSMKIPMINKTWWKVTLYHREAEMVKI